MKLITKDKLKACEEHAYGEGIREGERRFAELHIEDPVVFKFLFPNPPKTKNN